jgi:hypothetical protein
MLLSISDYDGQEAAAKCRVSYVEIMAFAPATLTLMGFPATVTQEQELSRYVDWNNSSSNAQYFEPDHFVRGPSVQTTFTPREADLVGQVSDHVATLTSRQYGREMRPISTLLSQFGLFRAIMSLQACVDRPLVVFEVGPGNGYLGALLIQAGLSYIGFDNAQALYLWQNRLLNECAGADFLEWVASEPPPNMASHRVHHLPWWHYLALRHHCPIRADVFVSNTNLGEMSHGALLYTARIAQPILYGSPISAFLFTNIGDAKQNSLATVEGELARADLGKVCGDLVQAFVPNGVEPLPALLSLDKAIPLYNPDKSEARFRTRDILKITADNLPSDMDFLGYVGTFSLPG